VNSPTPRERVIAALERRPLSRRVSHFELVFYLTMEAFGRVHPLHRDYSQWMQMEAKERQLHRQDMADLFIARAGRFGHNAIFVHPNPENFEECARRCEEARAERSVAKTKRCPTTATLASLGVASRGRGRCASHLPCW
jgi:uroporphyrinogen decarboxylase